MRFGCERIYFSVHSDCLVSYTNEGAFKTFRVTMHAIRDPCFVALGRHRLRLP